MHNERGKEMVENEMPESIVKDNPERPVERQNLE